MTLGEEIFKLLGKDVVLTTDKNQVFIGELHQLSITSEAEQFCLLVRDQGISGNVCMPLIEYKIFNFSECQKLVDKTLYDIQKKLGKIEMF